MLVLATSLSAHSAVSVQSGFWTDGTTWDTGNPPAGGTDYFIADGHVVESPNATGDYNFGGDNLTVQSGGTLRFENNHASGLQTNNYTFNSLTLLDGATMEAGQEGGGAFGASNYRINTTVEVNGSVDVTLSGGFYFSYMTLANGVSGDGTINFSRVAGFYGEQSGFELRLDATSTYSGVWNLSGLNQPFTTKVNAAGAFGTGTINIFDNMIVDNLFSGGLDSLAGIAINGTGELQLTNALNDLNSGITMTAGATLDLTDQSSTVASLIIDGNNVAAGTYNKDQLAALGYGGLFDGSTGTITVSAVPEPSSTALIGLAGLALILRRRRF